MLGSQITVACVQLCSSTDIQQNISVASTLITQAAAQGALFISTPEMLSVIDKRANKVNNSAQTEKNDPALTPFKTLAKQLKVYLHLGSLPIKVSGAQCANRSFIIDPYGSIISRYDKIHMFDVNLGSQGTYRESNDYRAGDQAVIARLPFGNIGLSICYDIRFPALYSHLASKGADILLIPAAFTATTGQAHWEVLLRARAIETGCFVIAAGQGGQHEDGRKTWGHSMIVDPWGDIVTEADQEPSVIYANLDLEKVNIARKKIPNLSHAKDFKSA